MSTTPEPISKSSEIYQLHLQELTSLETIIAGCEKLLYLAEKADNKHAVKQYSQAVKDNKHRKAEIENLINNENLWKP